MRLGQARQRLVALGNLAGDRLIVQVHELLGMGHRVIRQLVPGRGHRREHILVIGDVAADHEEGRFHAVAIEELEKPRHDPSIGDRPQLVAANDARVAVDVVRQRVEVDVDRRLRHYFPSNRRFMNASIS